MPELDPVTQDISANVVAYLAAMDEIIAKAEEVAAAVQAQEDALANMARMADDTAALLGPLASRMNDVRNAAESAAGGAGVLDGALSGLDGKLDDLVMLGAATVSELHDIRDAMAGVALAAAAMAAGTAKAAAATGAAATAGTVAGTRWWTLGMTIGQALHWIVMGTLEIAATALPALVALGAAAVAMAPTFTHIADQMNYLRTATGSWSGVMAASVGPLQAAGAASVRLRAAVAPDAYIIFGAAINAITGHVGAFSQIAQQASSVLAAFATKLSAELSGPAGAQIAGFFANAVKYMIQWGQLLGNLGHTFVNAMGAMWGVGQVLLDVLVGISRVLLAISSNPIGAWLIGTAAAMSALYRYSILLKNIFTWLGGTGLVSVIKYLAGVGTAALAAAAEFGVLDGAVTLLEGLLTPLIIFLTGPVGIAIAAVAAGLGIWYLATRRASDGTDNLIASINKLPPTLANTSHGMQEMEGNLSGLVPGLESLNTAFTAAGARAPALELHKFGETAAQMTADVTKGVSEIRKLAEEGVNLATGMAEAGARTGQLGAMLQIQAIQTAISDSKIQQLNQAIDQYVGMLTSATSGNANFITSMSNIGSVNATVSNNLGTSTVQLSLNFRQFGRALSDMGTVGAAAWQNFDQVLTGSIQPMMDNLRQMGVVGALTGHQISTAAIDMAVQWGKYAGSNKAAQATVMGFLRAQGLTFPSFRKFMEDATHAGAGQHQLNGIVAQGTIAFSKLSQMAKNAANAMNPLVAQAIDKAALQASGFNTNLGKLQTDMLNHAPAATITADMAAVNTSYGNAITMAEKTGNSITSNAQKSSQGVHQATSQMNTAWGEAKGKQMQLASQVQIGSQSIGSASNAAAGQVHAAMSSMAYSMDIAKQHATWLQQYIDGMHGKTIQVNTIFSTTGSSSPPKKAGGGYIEGHGTSTSDSNLIRASRGEFMMNAAAVDHYGRGVMEAMNAKRLAAGGPVGGSGSPSPSVLSATVSGGGGNVTLNHSQSINLKLDNQTVSTAQRKEVLVYGRRNPSSNWNLRVR